MSYSVASIAERIAPIARDFDLKAVWLFGSQARGEAYSDSDIDLLVDRGDIAPVSLLDPKGLIRLRRALAKVLETDIDLVTTHALKYSTDDEDDFLKNVDADKKLIYEKN